MENRLHLIIVFGLFTVTACFPQDNSGDELSTSSKIKFGVRLGGIVSQFNHAQPHISDRYGAVGGLVADMSVSSKFSIQGELSYLQQGGTYLRFTDNTRFGDPASITSFYATTSKVTAQYADFALALKYQPEPWGNFQPNIVAGPAIGYKIAVLSKYERTYYYNQTFYTSHGTEVISDQYEPFQVGAMGGIGGEISLGKQRLMIDFRYRYGVTPAKKSFSYIDLYAVQGNLYNNSFYITLGLGF